MNLLRRASSFLNGLRNSEESSAPKIGDILGKINKLKIVLISIPIVIIVIMFLALITAFDYKLNMIQVVSPNGSNSSGGVPIYDNATLEEYYKASSKAIETDSNANADLSGTEYGNIDGFNKHIKNNVCQAGYGTRQGVVTAGMSLIGDYIKATGNAIRYSQSSRHPSDVEGIVTDNLYFDCSSFAWWALYNGGFNLPSSNSSYSIYHWGLDYGIANSDVTKGQAGDFLSKNGHVALIVGVDGDSYYIAEAMFYGWGLKINKYSKTYYNNSDGYVVLQMDKYYSDSKNVKGGGSC